VTELQASVATAAAGVRQVSAASASANRAVATSVTQVTARLDNFSGGAPGTATVETKMTAIADRATGLEAKYTVKVTAGGAMAGFGLAASDNTAGSAVSAFIIQADKFAIVDSSYAGGLDTTPDVTAVPFGVDASGVYVNAPLNVNGTTGINLRSGGTNVGKIKLDASSNLIIQNTVSNKSILLTGATGLGGLEVDDYSTANTTLFHWYTPTGTKKLHISAPNTAGIATYVASWNGDLVVQAGTVGGNDMGLYAATFSFPGAAKMPTGTVTCAYNSSGAQTGAATATFSGTNKPGANTANTWWSIVLNGTTYYIPVWT
jgi:hypothetical protein